MSRRLISILLALLIGLQSVIMLADVHQFHQTENQIISVDLTQNNEITTDQHCHHSCHCHFAIFSHLLISKNALSIQPAVDYLRAYTSRYSALKLRPPIIV